MGRVSGKVAIVTGAAGLLGSAGARLLAEEGASVIFAGRSEKVNAVVAACRADGLEAAAFVGDHSVEEDVAAMVAFAVERYGRLDVLWNNAGPVDYEHYVKDTSVTEMTLDFFVEIFRGHAGAYFLCSKHAIPELIKSGGGSIINTSSTQSFGGDVSGVAYGVAKSAVNSLTENIATCYGADDIRCNAVAPGLVVNPAWRQNPAYARVFVDSQMLSRDGEPVDIANAVVYLASEESRFLTGQTIRVDGGLFGHQPMLATKRKRS